MNTPLLLITWRRPDTLLRVIDAIREVKPHSLYIASDGPRNSHPNEAALVAESRRLIETEIKWPCQIKRRYSEVNQGCRLAVINALDWFFENVEEGIILEDDCVPHPDFFNYCTTLLARFRDDSRVMSICGPNFQNGIHRGDGSYYFSIYPDPWGWATWSRAWMNYRKAEHIWPELRKRDSFINYFGSKAERNYWIQTFDSFYNDGSPDQTIWCYQWFLLSFYIQAIHVWPNVPLVYNCGFGSDATHTFGNNPCSPVSAIGDIAHPSVVAPNPVADDLAFDNRFNGRYVKDLQRYGLLYPIARRLNTARDQGFLRYCFSSFAKLISLCTTNVFK